ncbi:unnamed protein product [Heterobilharzia americana]|nr:unnamed protein product [Heterobilharzia americana]
MSDSDSTLPATDDFGSRFLEFDEYSFEKPDSNEIDAFSAFLPNFQTFTDRKSSLVDDRLSAKAATHRKPVSLAVDDEEDFNTIINVKANSDSEYDSDEMKFHPSDVLSC